MDSITQAVLGAVVADSLLGKHIGRKAALWGIFWGTAPDLDVLFNPLFSTIEQLAWHRGISHSVLLMLLSAPLITWIWRWLHGPIISWQRGIICAFLIWSTHVLIDCFTVYGTGVWEPFSDGRASLDILSIIDPIFSLPLLLATLIAFAWSGKDQTILIQDSQENELIKNKPQKRKWGLRLRHAIPLIALSISTAYVGFAGYAKWTIHQRFNQAITELASAQNISLPDTIPRSQRVIAPTLGNTLLWRCVVKIDDAFAIGYASILDDDPSIDFQWVKQQPELVNFDNPAIDAVKWFSQGFWVARQDPGDDTIRMSDIRFGEISAHLNHIEDIPRPWIFNFIIDGAELSQLREGTDNRGVTVNEMLDGLWNRMLGQR